MNYKSLVTVLENVFNDMVEINQNVLKDYPNSERLQGQNEAYKHVLNSIERLKEEVKE